jgi:hypothetical protein
VIARERSLSALIIAVFLAGGVIGGGPTSAHLSMFVELLAVVLAALAVAGLVDGNFPERSVPAMVLLLLICIVPLLQLVPLPADYWKSLPGRDIPGEISRLAGLPNLARPISLTPEETRLAALSLIVPASVFLATLQLGMRERDRIMMTIVLFAFASAILGIFQVAAGGGLNLGIYRQIHDGYSIGFFANRNHQATLLLIAIPMSVRMIGLQRWDHRTRTVMTVVALLFFSLSVVGTISRAGFLLLPLAVGGALVVWIGDLRDKRIWLGLAGLVIVLVAGSLAIQLTPLGHRVIHRFSDVGEDLRPIIWQGSWAAARSFWPIGSGTGSFVPVYKMFEDLNSVNDAWVNHAHDDYLELLLDDGGAAVLLFLGYLIFLTTALIRSVPMPLRSQRYVVVSTIAILMAHSLMDYPLRTFGLITIFAFANALLLPPRDVRRMTRSGSHPTSPPPAFARAPADV